MVLTESDYNKLKHGDSAPEFGLMGTDNEMHSLHDYHGKKGLLVIFMCNHCPYVKAKIDAIVKLDEKWGSRIAVIGINSNDPEYPGEGMENMQGFAKERSITELVFLEKDLILQQILFTLDAYKYSYFLDNYLL